jgi:hypothetical protein
MNVHERTGNSTTMKTPLFVVLAMMTATAFALAGCGAAKMPGCGAAERMDIAVLGIVELPGLVPYSPEMTMADAVALAGGVMPHEVIDAPTLRRGEEVLPVPQEEWAQVVLCPGDVVHVPQRAPY